MSIVSSETIFRDECMGALRWVPRGWGFNNDGTVVVGEHKLQQRWMLLGYTEGVITVRRYEWRDVPLVMELDP